MCSVKTNTLLTPSAAQRPATATSKGQQQQPLDGDTACFSVYVIIFSVSFVILVATA